MDITWKAIALLFGSGLIVAIFTTLMNRKLYKKQIADTDASTIAKQVGILSKIITEVNQAFEETKADRDRYKALYAQSLLDQAKLKAELVHQKQFLGRKTKELGNKIKELSKLTAKLEQAVKDSSAENERLGVTIKVLQKEVLNLSTEKESSKS